LTGLRRLTYPQRVTREPAKSFADRLPRVVPKEEQDISHLSDEMADILYPGRRPRPTRISVEFDAFEGPNYPRALDLARRSAVYREREHAALRHSAGFDAGEADLLRELYAIVGEITGTEVLVDGKRVPYARELWLPLMLFFVKGEATAS
jgi:hypothetical protein